MSNERIIPEMHLFKVATTGEQRSVELKQEAMKTPISGAATEREHVQSYLSKIALEKFKDRDDPNRPGYKIVDSRDDLMLWFMLPYAFYVDEDDNNAEYIAQFDALRVDFSRVENNTEEKEFTYVCPFSADQPMDKSTRGCLTFVRNGTISPVVDICKNCVNFGACTAAGSPVSHTFQYTKYSEENKFVSGWEK